MKIKKKKKLTKDFERHLNVDDLILKSIADDIDAVDEQDVVDVAV